MGRTHSNGYKRVGDFFPELDYRPVLKAVCSRSRLGANDAPLPGCGDSIRTGCFNPMWSTNPGTVRMVEQQLAGGEPLAPRDEVSNTADDDPGLSLLTSVTNSLTNLASLLGVSSDEPLRPAPPPSNPAPPAPLVSAPLISAPLVAPLASTPLAPLVSDPLVSARLMSPAAQEPQLPAGIAVVSSKPEEHLEGDFAARAVRDAHRSPSP